LRRTVSTGSSPGTRVPAEERVEALSVTDAAGSRSRIKEEEDTMPVLRTKSVGTKLTQDEYARIEALAGGQRLSEWVREILLKAVARQAQEQIQEEVLLAEVLALRTILLNLHYAVVTGETPTTDDVQALIERADQDKIQRAKERLWSASERRES
jgi:hypothetical protein